MSIFENNGDLACDVINRFIETGRVGKTTDSDTCIFQVKPKTEHDLPPHHAVLWHQMASCRAAIKQIVLSNTVNARVKSDGAGVMTAYNQGLTQFTKGLFRQDWASINKTPLPQSLTEKFKEVNFYLHSDLSRQIGEMGLAGLTNAEIVPVFYARTATNLEGMALHNRMVVEMYLRHAKHHEDKLLEAGGSDGVVSAQAIQDARNGIEQRLQSVKSLNSLLAQTLSLHKGHMPSLSF